MISQREARRLQKRVYELEKQEYDRNNAWCADWPNGANIGSCQLVTDSRLVGAIHTSRLLNHAVVASVNQVTGLVNFHAINLKAKP